MAIRTLTLAVLGAVLAVSGVPAQAQDKVQGSWIKKAPLPAALNEVQMAFAGGKIHALDGGVLGYTGPYHEEYDIAADKWRPRARVPQALDHVGATVLNGKIYLFGGFVGGGTHADGQPTALEYDPALDSWRLLAPMSAGRGSVGAAAVDGKIYVIGGRDPTGKTVNTNSVYDPATNTWKDGLAPLPKARDHLAIGVIDGRIHVAGGRFGASTDSTDLHDIYDPKTNTWTSGPPMPTRRSGLASTVYKGLFLVLGGELPTEQRTNTENEAFDPKTNSWRTLAPMPMGRHGANAATDGEHVYLAGGSHLPGGGDVTNELIVFTLP
jgi:N-acetylneuraminic acid mutarotase